MISYPIFEQPNPLKARCLLRAYHFSNVLLLLRWLISL